MSGHNGIYPPFIQMLIARIFEDKDKNGSYRSNQYYSAGRISRIIADFLINQLKYLGEKIDIGKAILISLVSSYGTKAQKSLEEVSRESLLPTVAVKNTLSSLTDLRLVRNVNGAFEIAHDFLAKIISSELVSSEEREGKKFKELLSSRTAAFPATKSGLTVAEHLHIYKFRSKILCTDDEVKLLLVSNLSGNGPITYWTKRYPRSKLRGWARHLLSESSREMAQAACRFLIKLGEKPKLSVLAESFSDYKEQNELSLYISDFATRDDIELLIALNKKRAEEIVNSSATALVKLLGVSDEAVLERLAKSNSENLMVTCERVALKLGDSAELRTVREGLSSRVFWQRLMSIYAVSVNGDRSDLAELQGLLQGKLSQKLRRAVLRSITRLATRLQDDGILESNLCATDKFIVENTISAIDGPSQLLSVDRLFSLYETYPFLVSRAICNMSQLSDVPKIKEILSKVPLGPSTRELVYAICRFGSPDEFTFLFKLFLDYREEISFWNAFAVVNRISHMATPAHLPLIEKVVGAKEFWNYYKDGNRPSPRMPLGDYSNVYFIKRLAGTAFGRIATREQFPIIFKMLQHEYWIIRHAALEAIRNHGNEDDLGELLEMALDRPSASGGLVEALSIIDDKINAGAGRIAGS